MENIQDNYNDELSPIIKWAGGKESEIKYVIPNSPSSFVNYYEPFVGGGSVFVSFNAQHFYINDKSAELIGLYKCIANQDTDFFHYLEMIIDSWNKMLAFASHHKDLVKSYIAFRENRISEGEMREFLATQIANHLDELHRIIPAEFSWHLDSYDKELKVNTIRKILRMRKIEITRNVMSDDDIFDNIETAFMSALYMFYRGLYNDKKLLSRMPMLAIAVFVFIRNYSYSGMFRYNKAGEFNVPYGGIAYNHKSLRKKANYYHSEKLLAHFAKTTIENLDFSEFFERHIPTEEDFVFLDPPYDSDFSTYAQNEFSRKDQERLANYLLRDCRAKWMMVIKNTDFIYSLYSKSNLNIMTFDKTYLVSFMNRNDKKAEHLIIMNY